MEVDWDACQFSNSIADGVREGLEPNTAEGALSVVFFQPPSTDVHNTEVSFNICIRIRTPKVS